jgi:TPR repeat protein
MMSRPLLIVSIALALAACKGPPGGEGEAKKAAAKKERPLPPLPRLEVTPPEAKAMAPRAPAVADKAAPLEASGPLGPLVAKCNDGDAMACRHGALDYLAGRGTPQDTAKGKAMLERSCDGGDPDGCVLLAIRLADPGGVDADPAGALAAAQHACDLGDQHCAMLAHLYRRGVGAPADEARFRELIVRACRGGDKRACK